MPKHSFKKQPRAHVPLRAGSARAVAGQGNAYARTRDAGHKVDRRAQVLFVLVIALAVTYLVGLVLPKDIFDAGVHAAKGYDGYSVSLFAHDLTANINALVVTLAGQTPATGTYLPSIVGYVIIALSGACMALSGAVYQGTFRNALVTPSTLGVMAGCSLGMAVWVALFSGDDAAAALFGAEPAEQLGSGYLSSAYGLSVCSFAGCVAVVGLVLAVVRVGSRGSVSGIMMIVTGQVVAGIMAAITNTMRYYYVTVDPDGSKAQMLMQLQISSFFRGYALVDVLAVGVPLLVAFAVVMRYRDQLTLLSFSEAEARSMGVETRRLRFAVVGLCTLLTAIVVSFCGHVGFIGFLAPHLARRLVGPHYRFLIPASCVLGALMVLAAYVVVCMTLGSAYSTMTGMFISILGAGVFVATLVRGKGAARGL